MIFNFITLLLLHSVYACLYNNNIIYFIIESNLKLIFTNIFSDFSMSSIKLISVSNATRLVHIFYRDEKLKNYTQ